MATNIIDRLWLGGFGDMLAWGKRTERSQSIICVLEDKVLETFEMSIIPQKVIFSSIISYDDNGNEWTTPEALDKCTKIIEAELTKLDNYVLCHYGAGQERSPLAVMWWLHRYRDMNLNQAYNFKKLRPQIMDRRSWIKWSYGDQQ